MATKNHPPSPSVLVVDPSEESRLVLCELLSHEGIAVAESSSIANACVALGRADINAVFIEGDAIGPVELGLLARAAAPQDAPIVVAGTNRPLHQADGEVLFVRKPYHYRELIHKIWIALGATDAQARAAA